MSLRHAAAYFRALVFIGVCLFSFVLFGSLGASKVRNISSYELLWFVTLVVTHSVEVGFRLQSK